MRISLHKFGTTLVSRQTGKEAYAAFLPTLAEVTLGESIEVDFDGVVTFAPSWGDEFLTPLVDRFDHVSFVHAKSNPSVVLTLELLEKIKQSKFNVLS
jgi:hypothetical protein